MGPRFFSAPVPIFLAVVRAPRAIARCRHRLENPAVLRPLYLAFAFVLVATLLAGCNPIRKLHTDNVMLKARVEQLEQDRDANAKALQQHEATVAKYEADLASARADAQEARERFENLNRVVASGQQGQADALAKELAERTARENEMRLELDRLRASNEVADTRILAAETQAKVANEATEAVRAELAQVRAQLDAAKAESQSAAAKLAEAEKQLADVRAEAERAKAQELELAEKAKTRAAKARESADASVARLRESLGAGTIVEVRESDPPVVRVVLPSDALFQTGTVVLSEDGKKDIETLAKFLVDSKPASVEVVGHTDSTPVKNMPFVDNWDLGGARASSVARALRGAGSLTISAVSRADQEPLADNATTEGRRQNRRVEVLATLAPPLAE